MRLLFLCMSFMIVFSSTFSYAAEDEWDTTFKDETTGDEKGEKKSHYSIGEVWNGVPQVAKEGAAALFITAAGTVGSMLAYRWMNRWTNNSSELQSPQGSMLEFVSAKEKITKKKYIGGVPAEIEELINLYRALKHSDNEVKRSAQACRIKLPEVYLLEGPQGTGKSYLAKVVAGELDCPFFNLKTTQIAQMYVGESGKNMQRIIEFVAQAAKSNPSRTAVIFADEVDAIVSSRKNEHNTNQEHTQILRTLLQNIDGFNKENKDYHIIFMAATNRKDQLDDAFLGRVSEKIHIPNPDKKQRMLLFKYYLKGENDSISRAQGFNFNLIARVTEGLSVRDIKAISDGVHRKAFLRKIKKLLPKNDEKDKNELLKLELDDLVHKIATTNSETFPRQRAQEAVKVILNEAKEKKEKEVMRNNKPFTQWASLTQNDKKGFGFFKKGFGFFSVNYMRQENRHKSSRYFDIFYSQHAATEPLSQRQIVQTHWNNFNQKNLKQIVK